jgi:hypothetical protein
MRPDPVGGGANVRQREQLGLDRHP